MGKRKLCPLFPLISVAYQRMLKGLITTQSSRRMNKDYRRDSTFLLDKKILIRSLTRMEGIQFSFFASFALASGRSSSSISSAI